MEYLLKASAVVVIFYTCYKLFLQRDTFFESNRGFLLIGLITAFCLPFVVIPIYVEHSPIILNNLIFTEIVSAEVVEEIPTFTVLQFLSLIYTLGITFFLGKFLVQLTSLIKLLVTNTAEKDGRYTYIKTNKNVSPFSFFNWIVFNPNQFNENELKQIITHEKVHVRQHHTIDILLTQLACIALWFNPFIWLYNKDLKQNLEFIADQNAQQRSSCKKSYQYTLLKTSMPKQQLALTNNFYNSLIKKRIVMLHKSKSKKSNQLKYLLIIPVLAVFLMSFNTKTVYITKEVPENSFVTEGNSTIDNLLFEEITPEVINESQPKEEPIKAKISTAKASQKNNANTTKEKKSFGDIQMVMINKDFTDADFDKVKAILKKEGITAKFKGIKRNDAGEITAIKINLESKQSNANYNISSDDTIKPIKITYDREGGNISIGNGHKIHTSGKAHGVHVISSDDDNENVEVIIHDDHDVDVDDDVIIMNKGNKVVVDLHKAVDEGQIIIKRKGNTVIDLDDDNDDIFIIKENKNGSVLRIKNNGKNEPMYIINGKVADKDAFKHLKQKDIESVNILKDQIAIEKYGNKAKNGVVEIISNKNNKTEIHFDDDKDPLYIIDGKEVSKDTFEDLDTDDIEKVEVSKGEGTIKKYGDKAKDGVIEITTKKKKN